MKLQETIRRILREETEPPLYFRRRVSASDIERLVRDVKISISGGKNKSDALYDAVQNFISSNKEQFKDYLWSINHLPSLIRYINSKLNEEPLNESILREESIKRILMEDKKMSLYFRRRIDLKQFEEQLDKGKVYVYYDSNSLKDYKWKLITATLENYIYYKYDTEIDRTNNETYETIDYLVDIFNDELTDMYESENRKRRPDY